LDKRQKKGKYASSRALRLAWTIFFIAVTFVILSINYLPDRVSLEVGDRVDTNIYYSGSATTFVSNTLTDEAKNAAAQHVEQIYRYDDMVIPHIEEDIDAFFTVVGGIKNNSLLTGEEKLGHAQDVLPGDIPESSLSYALTSSDQVLAELSTYLKNTVRTAYGSGVMQADIEDLKSNILNTISESNYKTAAKEFLSAVVGILDFAPNMLQDQVATMAAVEKAMSEVSPVQVTVRPGELLIAAGEKVTDANLEALTTLGLQTESNNSMPYIGLLAFVFFMFVIFGTYLRFYCREVWEDSAKILLLGLLISSTLFLGKVFTMLNISSRWETDALMGFLIPVPACAMLTAALFDHKVGLLATIFVSICAGVLGGGQLGYTLASLMGGIVGIYQVTKMGQRSKYVTAALYVGAAYAATVAAWGMMWSYTWEYIGIGVIMSLINGLLSAILTIGSLPFWEGAFGITTEVRLLELCNSNQPLLRQLMLDAPGTYQHSIIVGNLAEAAAEDVGANSLLVRVGAYYHDIGKVKRPYFFIENQVPGENPHDKLQPTLSTLIIASHPKEGVEMAAEYKLPEAVLEIIGQHHGTGLAGSFYQKAQDSGMEDVKEADFRYPGPKPQSMEAAIVLLADSVEAAIHSMEKPTKGQIDGKIREIIKAKFDDGQLSESPLTFKDLDTIASAFSRVLAGVSHSRISYPSQVEKELKKKRGTKNVSIYKQSSEKDSASQKMAELIAPSSPDNPANGKEPSATQDGAQHQPDDNGQSGDPAAQ